MRKAADNSPLLEIEFVAEYFTFRIKFHSSRITELLLGCIVFAIAPYLAIIFIHLVIFL